MIERQGLGRRIKLLCSTSISVAKKPRRVDFALFACAMSISSTCASHSKPPATGTTALELAKSNAAATVRPSLG